MEYMNVNNITYPIALHLSNITKTEMLSGGGFANDETLGILLSAGMQATYESVGYNVRIWLSNCKNRIEIIQV